MTPAHRVIRLAGDDGNLTKESFIKILKSSDFFMKAFDKNKDGIVTEVNVMWCLNFDQLVVRVDFHFIHDVPDNSFSPEMRTSYLFSDFTLKVVHFVTIYQPRN